MIVLDASAFADALIDQGDTGETARRRLSGEIAYAPHLIDLEVTSMLKRMERSGRVEPEDSRLAARRLMAYPLRRLPHFPLLERIWELRHNLSIYDASYVALAEELDAPLLTSDAAFVQSPGIKCRVELVDDM